LAPPETTLKEGRLEARLCSLVQPLIRTYLDAFFKELGVRANAPFSSRPDEGGSRARWADGSPGRGAGQV